MKLIHLCFRLIFQQKFTLSDSQCLLPVNVTSAVLAVIHYNRLHFLLVLLWIEHQKLLREYKEKNTWQKEEHFVKPTVFRLEIVH